MKSKTYRKLVVRITLIVILIIMMAVTTYAYVASVLRVADNTFSTGLVDIDLNGGNPIVHGIGLIEPGGTYLANFYVKNNATDPLGVWYKIYFTDVAGYLSQVLEVSLYTADDNGEMGEALWENKTMAEINENVDAFEEKLLPNERIDFIIKFHYPEEAGNDGMGKDLSFNIKADATQVKNNPNKEFNTEPNP